MVSDWGELLGKKIVFLLSLSVQSSLLGSESISSTRPPRRLGDVLLSLPPPSCNGSDGRTPVLAAAGRPPLAAALIDTGGVSATVVDVVTAVVEAETTEVVSAPPQGNVTPPPREAMRSLSVSESPPLHSVAPARGPAPTVVIRVRSVIPPGREK